MTYKELRFFLQEDAKRNGCVVSWLKYVGHVVLRSESALAYRYIKCLRYCEFLSGKKNIAFRLLFRLMLAKKNYLGGRYHIQIPLNKTGYGLRIMHLSGGGWYIIECQ